MDPQYCIYCGGKLIKVNSTSHLRFECTHCDYIHWLNSRPCAAAVIVENKRVLLTKRAIEPYKDCWDLPGGFLELGEDPVVGLHREIDEELGATIEIVKFLGHYVGNYGDDKYMKTLNCTYLCQLTTPIRHVLDDISDCEWFTLDKLPENNAFPCHEQIFANYAVDIINI